MTHTKKHCWNCHGLGQWHPNSRSYKEACYVCAGTGSAEVAELRSRVRDLDGRIQDGDEAPETVREFAAAWNELKRLTTGEAA